MAEYMFTTDTDIPWRTHCGLICIRNVWCVEDIRFWSTSRFMLTYTTAEVCPHCVRPIYQCGNTKTMFCIFLSLLFLVYYTPRVSYYVRWRRHIYVLFCFFNAPNVKRLIALYSYIMMAFREHRGWICECCCLIRTHTHDVGDWTSCHTQRASGVRGNPFILYVWPIQLLFCAFCLRRQR